MPVLPSSRPRRLARPRRNSQSRTGWRPATLQPSQFDTKTQTYHCMRHIDRHHPHTNHQSRHCRPRERLQCSTTDRIFPRLQMVPDTCLIAAHTRPTDRIHPRDYPMTMFDRLQSRCLTSHRTSMEVLALARPLLGMAVTDLAVLSGLCPQHRSSQERPMLGQLRGTLTRRSTCHQCP